MTDKKKNGWAPEPLRDHERALREINGREQIFVVDDSSTMRRNHWDQVVKVVHALGYLVKHVDPDGVELFFTSRPAKAKKSGAKEITSLVRSLEEHGRKRPEGPCNMENSLGPIWEHVKSSLTKGSMFRQQTNRHGIMTLWITDTVKKTVFGICSWEALAAISTKITMLKVEPPSPETWWLASDQPWEKRQRVRPNESPRPEESGVFSGWASQATHLGLYHDSGRHDQLTLPCTHYWRKHSKTTCEDSGSDNWYTAVPGQCNDLVESDHAIEIWTDDRNFYTYPNPDCSGSRQKTLDGRGCHSLQGNNWGVRMECD
ncbi:hypothetical protein LA080_007757 [Diaporthe eres]|nr:hypothetical protein LA080_007757 [Diaporthe eres]